MRKGPTLRGGVPRASDPPRRPRYRDDPADDRQRLGYKWSLREVCARYGIRQFIKPQCPWQNGKVERPGPRPRAYRQVFTRTTTELPTLAPWLEYYNTDAVTAGGRPPISRLSPT